MYAAEVPKGAGSGKSRMKVKSTHESQRLLAVAGQCRPACRAPRTARRGHAQCEENTLYKFYYLLFFIVFLAGCASSPALNSERIEERFGSYGIEVLKASGDVRVSNLYSTHDGVRITRTLAVVRFTQPPDPSIEDQHALIVAGASIGSTFKSAGFNIRKTTLEICKSQPARSVTTYLAGMHLDTIPELAVHRYRFLVSRDGRDIPYATITEIHHPDYLTIADLRDLYLRPPEDYVESDEGCFVHR